MKKKDLRNKCCKDNFPTAGYIASNYGWFTSNGFCSQECFNDYILRVVRK